MIPDDGAGLGVCHSRLECLRPGTWPVRVPVNGLGIDVGWWPGEVVDDSEALHVALVLENSLVVLSRP